MGTRKRLGKLQPSRYLTLRSALEKALEFERSVIKLYNDLANNVKDKDHGTYHLALDLLDAELEDEQTIEDILAKAGNPLNNSNIFEPFFSFILVNRLNRKVIKRLQSDPKQSFRDRFSPTLSL